MYQGDIFGERASDRERVVTIVLILDGRSSNSMLELSACLNDRYREERRVVFLVRKFGGGGAERVTSILCNYFARNGIAVFACELDEPSDDYQLDSRVIRIAIKPSRNKLLKIGRRLIAVKHMIQAIDPCCVVALGGVCRYLRWAKRSGEPKIIVSERNYPDMQYTPLEKRWFEQIYRQADVVVFQTPEARSCFSLDVENKGIIIPNPVIPRLPVYSGERSKRVVTFARLEKQKNLGLLVNAFAQFQSSHDDWILEIYGKGSEKEFLERTVTDLGLERSVSLHPFSANIHEQVKDAGMFVSTSDYEGLQNSLMEAMAMGVPCIATDCLGGGARVLTDNGKRGLLVPRNDEAELVDAMSRVADDSVLSKTLAERGKEISVLCDEDKVAQQWLDLVQ